jgi:murein DD-endopeptidase MepM/ murein hydrolase activator NlpD
VACGLLDGDSEATAVPRERVVVDPLPPIQVPVSAVVARGDTLETICRQLAGEDWVGWRDALVAELDPRRLRPGTAFDGLCTPAGRLVSLTVSLDRRTEIRFVRGEDGIGGERYLRPVRHEVQRLEGVVESSLFGAVNAAGGQPDVAVRLAEIFQWDIDFFRDLRQGDSFTVLVDHQTIDGEFYRYGEIYVARFVNRDRVLDAVAFPDGDGRRSYFDLEGRPLRKQFLRSPLKFSRITSRFSLRRFHPVLKRTMPHYGVDYGAPVGTPVHVTADGVVTRAGRNGGAGRMVTVRHPNGYETNYLHLRRYGGGIRKGVRVSQGQVIGYVGSSGYSTGPHLDYRVKLNGSWVNPLTISSPPAKPLDADQLKRFLAHALGVLALLDGREPPAGAHC